MENTAKMLGIPTWALAVVMGIAYLGVLVIGLLCVLAAKWIFERTCYKLADYNDDRRRRFLTVRLIKIKLKENQSTLTNKK
jgi:hypothetical protein